MVSALPPVSSAGTGRQLVVCLDGTGNRFCDQPSNVLRVVRALHPDCMVYYDQGVGTFGLRETLFEWQKLPAKILGLAFGWGIARTVEGAFRFLSQHYRPGDQLYLFGFSRGAYAVRALLALLHAVGLVAPHQTHLFDYAWALLRKKSAAGGEPDLDLLAQFKATFGRPVSVRFLGLFDTVTSVGWLYNPLVLPYTSNNPLPAVVRHALSIDERRCFFRQNRWGREFCAQQDIKEVWFAGVHSDVGGSYPKDEAGLALVSCDWMLREAAAAGLVLDPARLRGVLVSPAVLAEGWRGPLHDSLRGAWWLAEWLPRRAWSMRARRRRWYAGAMPPLRSPRPRPLAATGYPVLVHESVVRRIAAGLGYAPVNLPERYTIEPAGGWP